MRMAPIGITRLGAGLYVPVTVTPPSSGDWESVNLGTWDIRAYLRLPGDHAYTIPDGYYYGGNLTDAHHPANPTGKFGGYALFRGSAQGAIIVDLGYPGKSLPGGLATANGDMTFAGDGSNGNTNGIIMSGFRWQYGVVNYGATNVHEWYNEHTFPYSFWFAEPGYPNFSYHGTNDTMFIGYGAWRNYFNGCYWHDCGTGPTLHNGLRSLHIIGSRIGLVHNGGRGDAIHPDGIAGLGGNIWNLWFEDLDINGGGSAGAGLGMQFQNLSGDWFGPNGIPGDSDGNWISWDNNNWFLSRIWVHDCGLQGFQVNCFYKMDGTPTFMNAVMDNVHSWNNNIIGQGGVGDSAANFKEGVDTNAFITTTIGQNPQPSRINFSDPNNNCSTGVDKSIGGTVADPATAWQAVVGQRYGDILDYHGTLNWAMP